MSAVHFIDTTLRDGQQSLWAMNMRSGMMLPALADMDNAGFEAMEFFVPAVQMKKMIRDLGEDPWQWLRLGTEGIRKTPLRMHGGYKSGFSKVPESVGKLLVQKVIDHGITTLRQSNSWNDYNEMKEELEELRKMGMASVINLIYSVSPRHTDEYYVDRATAAAAIKPYRICFKDVGGLLTPERVRELLPKILKAVGKTPVEFHCHCNNGLGPLNVLEVVKLGVTHIHAAIPPLAHGSSNPSVFNVEKNLRALGYDPKVDISALVPVEKHFTHIASREGFPIGAPLEYDQTQYLHQIPGGMISNLRYQLKKIGMEHRIKEILEESIQVRADFGYPIMVTPLSQFVGSQASINVIVGERYKEVTDEVIQYALGHWGREAIAVMDNDVREKILDRRRTQDFANWEPPNLSLKEVRKKFGENLTDEELILRTYIDEDAVNIARNAPAPRPYLSAGQPLITLLRELGQRPSYTQAQVRQPGFSLTLK
jgi:oxaloacetate decarboxylase alpha subunit